MEIVGTVGYSNEEYVATSYSLFSCGQSSQSTHNSLFLMDRRDKDRSNIYIISPTVKIDADATQLFSTIVAKSISSFSKRDLSGFRKLVNIAVSTTLSRHFIDETMRETNRY